MLRKTRYKACPIWIYASVTALGQSACKSLGHLLRIELLGSCDVILQVMETVIAHKARGMRMHCEVEGLE